ncbi:DUF2335 domain-containing protein [Apilactobacillus timberlakei]|uniref:DUF2335 domain-containing protein n=1 Tax=Apilactobacillus timberlakei TaxID=2008380 RepID=UPI00112A859F|nr:DUF2335 domain-containing protein [Apilactobacillus timberlakei]TPR19973.1 DUF2335 domain-containing protein [Apilactobacillus timberlakei]TPR21691.1 DUF2335 domain-containing protein [Apilactobacillus timberlakei]TPR22937.1 DUF2335 domain-containing protein [Apilactobacillus timberlakei]
MTDELPNKNKSKDSELISETEALPKEKKQELIATMSMSMYSGPIPHPDIIKEYEKIYPGSAKKMIDNGLEESSHRRMLETKRQKRRGVLSYIVLFATIIFTLAFLFIAYLLLTNGHVITGTIFGAGNFILFIGSMTEMVDKLSSNNDLNSENEKESK